jgi:hypothetical protein
LVNPNQFFVITTQGEMASIPIGNDTIFLKMENMPGVSGQEMP